jgi:hypothetical protein
MSGLEILATAVWAIWAIWLASLGGLDQVSLWIAAVTGSLLALAWSALFFGAVLVRIRPPRPDCWALALCPVAWLITAGAIIWAGLDTLKKFPIINRVRWEKIIGNTATWPVNRNPLGARLLYPAGPIGG